MSNEQKTSLGWTGKHMDNYRTPSAVNRGNILEASATLAMITEPQQTVWLRHLLIKTFEISQGKEKTDLLLTTHDWLDEPLSASTHPHLFPLRTT